MSSKDDKDGEMKAELVYKLTMAYQDACMELGQCPAIIFLGNGDESIIFTGNGGKKLDNKVLLRALDDLGLKVLGTEDVDETLYTDTGGSHDN